MALLEPVVATVKGDTGVSITGAVNQNGNLILSLSNGTYINAGALPTGGPGVVTANTPLYYNSATQTISIDVSSFLTSASISGKADKVVGAVSGNVANLDGTGDLVDSGVNLATKANASTVNSHISNLSNPHATTAQQVGLGNLVNALQLQAANNLSDLTNATSARTALGLGSAATANTAAFDAAGAASTVQSALTSYITSNNASVTNLVSDLAAKSPIASPTFTGTATTAALTSTGLSTLSGGIQTNGASIDLGGGSIYANNINNNGNGTYIGDLDGDNDGNVLSIDGNGVASNSNFTVGGTTLFSNGLTFGQNLYTTGGKLILFESTSTNTYGWGITANSMDQYVNGAAVAHYTIGGNSFAGNLTTATSTAPILIGSQSGYGYNYPGIWLNQSSPDLTNYAFLGDPSQGNATYFNTPGGATMQFRQGNGTVMQINTNGSLQINSTAMISQLVITSPTVPSSATATGVKGTVAYDSSFVYICISSNSWKRAALSGW